MAPSWDSNFCICILYVHKIFVPFKSLPHSLWKNPISAPDDVQGFTPPPRSHTVSVPLRGQLILPIKNILLPFYSKLARNFFLGKNDGQQNLSSRTGFTPTHPWGFWLEFRSTQRAQHSKGKVLKVLKDHSAQSVQYSKRAVIKERSTQIPQYSRSAVYLLSSLSRRWLGGGRSGVVAGS